MTLPQGSAIARDRQLNGWSPDYYEVGSLLNAPLRIYAAWQSASVASLPEGGANFRTMLSMPGH